VSYGVKTDGEPEHGKKISGFKGHNRVFVKIQDGCDNVCSYCKVRIVRGRSRSRDFQDILDECRGLISGGVKEIVLTGICLGSYGKDLESGINLSGLIKELCGIEGEWRIRLSSIEPKDVNEGLISRIASQKKICRHLHIPFQSGDDFILNKMRRPYKRQDYFDITARLKKEIPDMAISTDIMVGFPGETNEMFGNTVGLLEKIRPMRTHIFPFSKRSGTEAAKYRDDVPSIVKREREEKLSLLAAELSKDFTGRFIGKETDVLVEERRTREGELQGYSDRYIKVYINGPDSLKNRIIQCRLALTNSKAYGILPSYLI
jgi:threonylcarbamoyladenosine tRNA methylthiotransferase MtaB